MTRNQQRMPDTLAVLEAAGKTLDELMAQYDFEVVHEEDPHDPRPMVRILQFTNLVQATEFAKLFDPGSHRDVWFTYPEDVNALFDQQVCLSVVFRATMRPATVHGEDDMHDVAASLRAEREHPVPTLAWDSAGTDEPGDQHADSLTQVAEE